MSIMTGRRLNYFYGKIKNLFALKSIYGDTAISLGRKTGTTIGKNSLTIGTETTASGTGDIATGYRTTASGGNSHSEGNQTVAAGNSSYAGGIKTTASGIGAHAEGVGTTALDYQHTQGHYNDTTKAPAGVMEGTGSGTALCIGNGTYETASNAARIDYNGKMWCKKAYSATGADYAELFEWEDGNLDTEDRRGYFVTMDGEKIRKADAGDWILGIISANPCVLGNTDMEWQGQFLKDEFGDYIIEHGVKTVTETVYVTDTDGNVVLDDKGNPVTKEVEKEVHYQFYKVNPDYDPNEEYIFRMDRKEWDAVGMIGVLAVRDDGTCKVSGFCTCDAGGIATASETGYRVISRVNDHIVKVVLI